MLQALFSIRGLKEKDFFGNTEYTEKRPAESRPFFLLFWPDAGSLGIAVFGKEVFTAGPSAGIAWAWCR